VAVLLGPGDREEVLEEALAAARQIGTEGSRAEALLAVGRLAPEGGGLPDHIRAQAARLADSSARAKVFSAIAAKLDVRGLVESAESILAVVDRSEPVGILRALAERWSEFCRLRNATPADELGLWLAQLSRAGRSDLVGSLTVLTPVIESIGGQPALTEMAQAIIDSGHWWP